MNESKNNTAELPANAPEAKQRQSQPPEEDRWWEGVTLEQLILGSPDGTTLEDIVADLDEKPELRQRPRVEVNATASRGDELEPNYPALLNREPLSRWVN